jgi:hypothetical protein
VQGTKVCLTSACDEYVSASTAANVKVQAQAAGSFIDVGNASVVNVSPALTSAGSITATSSVTATTYLKSAGVAWTALGACTVAGIVEWVTDLKAWARCDGTAWVLMNGRFRADAPEAQFRLTPGINPTTSPVYDRSPRVASASVTHTCTPTATGTLSSGSTTREWLNLNTSAGAGDSVSCIDSAAWLLTSTAFFDGQLTLPGTLANSRLWAGAMPSDPLGACTLPANSVGFRQCIGDTNWQFCTADNGGTTSCTDTGVALVAGGDAELFFVFNATAAGYSWRVQAGGVVAYGTKTTNIPSATLEKVFVGVKAVNAGAQTARLGPVLLGTYAF